MIHLSIKGTPEFPRYLITHQNGQFWSGTEWVPKEHQGHLYADANEALKTTHDLYRTVYQDAKFTEFFILPLTIEVHADTPLLPSQIRKWLRKALYVECNHQKYGNGPSDDSLILVRIDFSGLTHEAQNAQHTQS